MNYLHRSPKFFCQFRDSRTWEELSAFLPVIQYKSNSTQNHMQVSSISSGGSYVHMPVGRIHHDVELGIIPLQLDWNLPQALFCLVLKTVEQDLFRHTILHDCSLLAINHGISSANYNDDHMNMIITINLTCRDIEHF